ncbi:MAG TPA: hypothetical protein VFV67_11965 [Actinophytocola sp.]|uniref:hypothetical protein n=1 Tax=Actinophytocola sp. TaxID=1872138 RepID=UPI002DBA331C|nr:hypothetical protein [Actinophytocola sp.]HEU5471362.1 hypothetical protein [Actinophytocola sp.]
MAVELLVSVLKGAGTANNIRKILFDPTVVEQAASVLAAISQETAERLFREASSLPPKEQEAALEHVALLLEVASTVDDRRKPRLRFLPPDGRDLPDVQAQVERLIWLAVIYRILGHHVKAGHRLQRAKEKLPELRNAMELDVHGLVLLGGSGRTGLSQLSRLAAREKDNEKTLSVLNHVCTRLEALSP